jgi:hypothetical protein
MANRYLTVEQRQAAANGASTAQQPSLVLAVQFLSSGWHQPFAVSLQVTR